MLTEILQGPPANLGWLYRAVGHRRPQRSGLLSEVYITRVAGCPLKLFVPTRGTRSDTSSVIEAQLKERSKVMALVLTLHLILVLGQEAARLPGIITQVG